MINLPIQVIIVEFVYSLKTNDDLIAKQSVQVEFPEVSRQY